MRLFILLQVVVILAVEGRVVDFEQDVGGIADDFSGWFALCSAVLRRGFMGFESYFRK